MEEVTEDGASRPSFTSVRPCKKAVEKPWTQVRRVGVRHDRPQSSYAPGLPSAFTPSIMLDGLLPHPRKSAHMATDPRALIVVDMQRCMADPASGARNNPDAEANMALLLSAWRHARLPVVHVRHLSRTVGSPFWPGQAGAEFQPLFTPMSDEHVVEKNVPDAFLNTGLERWLRVRGVERVVVIGVSTNISVESTVRTASNLGFQTVVVSDATFAFEKRDYTGVLRSAAEVHAMSLANLSGEFATAVPAAEVLSALPTVPSSTTCLP